MDHKTFDDILETQIDITRTMLASKRTEYALGDVDVLRNFGQAAHVQENKPRQALAGMMVKHTISIYDMINSDHLFDDAKWDEKITDHINYLILLKAVVSEENAKDRSDRVQETMIDPDITYFWYTLTEDQQNEVKKKLEYGGISPEIVNNQGQRAYIDEIQKGENRNVIVFGQVV